MIIKLKSDGTFEQVLHDRIFQGSHKIHDIKLISPFDQNYTIIFNIKLPNGCYYSDLMMYKESIDNLNYWSYPINSTMTSIPGKIELSFNISLEDKVLETAKTHYYVEETVLLGNDFEEHLQSFNELLKWIEEHGSGGTKCCNNVWSGEDEPPSPNYNIWLKLVADDEPVTTNSKMMVKSVFPANSSEPQFGNELTIIEPSFGEEILKRPDPLFGVDIKKKGDKE